MNTANIIEKKILGAQWRLSLDCCHIGPWLTKSRGESGSDGTLLSPQEALRAALPPPSLFPLCISAATGLFSPLPNAHISAPLAAMTDSLPALGAIERRVEALTLEACSS